MQCVDCSLPSPEANLALDETLLEEAERAMRQDRPGEEPLETLRLWEPDRMFVVVGRSSRIEEEVDPRACQADGIPVLRRCSGGAAVVVGPGCLMYALILSLARRPALRAIDRAHCFVLETIAQALQATGLEDVRPRGTSDLAVGDRKFSGNSARCRRDHLLYHGTLLYDFPLDRIDRYLLMPPRQPAYRQARPHDRFLTNLPTDATTLRHALVTAFC